jgi:rhodanese-related sulfurtransferase
MSPDTIDAEELRRALQSDHPPVLVNALSREGFERQRIPGSISIPASEALRLAREVLAPDQPIVVYCSRPACTASPTLAAKLTELGFSDVRDFEGGLEEWRAAGYPIETSEPAHAGVA